MTPHHIKVSKRILLEIVEGTRTRVFFPKVILDVVGRCVLVSTGETSVPALVHRSFMVQVCGLSDEHAKPAGYSSREELIAAMRLRNPDLTGSSIITGIDIRLTTTGLALI